MKKNYHIDFLILCILFVIGAIICFIQGQDATWDFANYHYYGPWAFLNNRIGFDIMPGGIISYINPILDFPLLFFVKYLNNHPYLISFLISIPGGGGYIFSIKLAG